MIPSEVWPKTICAAVNDTMMPRSSNILFIVVEIFMNYFTLKCTFHDNRRGLIVLNGRLIKVKAESVEGESALTLRESFGFQVLCFRLIN